VTEKQPKIDLTMFFLSISSAAFMGLGIGVDEESQESAEKKNIQMNLPLVQQNIQLLELMEEKTEGNRNSGEDQLLKQLLFELRMRYVEAKERAK
jgi:hypothetical protein